MRLFSSGLLVVALGAGLGCATGAQIAGTEGTGTATGPGGAGGATAGSGGTATGGDGSGAGQSGGAGGSTGGAGGGGTGGAPSGGTGGETGQGGTTTGSGGTGGGVAGTGGTGGAPGHTCGDDVLAVDEECDGTSFGANTCVSLGFVGGTLTCSPDCEIDETQCHKCGNGSVEPALGEDCDFDAIGKPLVLTTCAGLGFAGSSANPGCDPTCHYDTTPCLCGDGMVDGDEECDGANLDGNTCVSLGFTAGTLMCTGACKVVTLGCTKCGNGVVQPGEACDDGNVLSGDGCSATCQNEVLTCDPDGTYAIVQGGPVSYSCCSGLVSVNVSSFVLTADGATIYSSPSNPAAMTGSATTCPAGNFNNSASLPGGCTETYSVTGSFTGPNTWSGLYTLSFTGADCGCFGGLLGTPCVGQAFPVTAMR